MRPCAPEDIEPWAQQWRQPFKGAPIAVAVERFKGPIVTALSQSDCFVWFPINRAPLATYRHTWVPCDAKDDPSDTPLALE
ncbi:MAG: hypothetical protein GKR94_32165 [Gammaproteobacteria bacterium]|nr:hypothetical protein [Gammaproteobacteria bacterium]